MAARKMMERETVLGLDRIQNLFNKFFRKGHRFYGDVLDSWISHAGAKRRLFGITPNTYHSLDPAGKDVARKRAKDQMAERYGSIFQRRHDCIHNCDRPKVAPQSLVKGETVLKIIEDVEFLVNRCNEHSNTELREFLQGTGCPSAIITQVGY